MAEMAFASQDFRGLRKAVAWAVASMCSAHGPESGSVGFSAAAYAIFYDDGKIRKEGIETSQKPNDTNWLASIKSIIFVLKNIGLNYDLTIFIQNKTLIQCYDQGWINADGNYSKNYEEAKEIFDLRYKKGINLKIKYGKPDRGINNLRVRANMAAKAKDDLLTIAERSTIPGAKDATSLNKYLGFSAVDDDATSGTDD